MCYLIAKRIDDVGYVKSKTFLWLEDRKDKSSYIFWKTLMEHL